MFDFRKMAIRQLRVNVKSLSAELRFIRHEMRKARNSDERGSLQSHRAVKVKPESRLAHLALAYVRKAPYRTVESSTKNPVSHVALASKVKRFLYCCEQDDVKNWLES